MKMHAPLEKFGVENIYGIVKSIEDAGDVKRVITEDATYEAKTIILATGAKNRALGVAGEEEYTAAGCHTVQFVMELSSVTKTY